MDISGYKSEEELNELLDAGKITVLVYVTHQSKELTKEFEDFCSDRDLSQNEDSAEQFVDMRQQIFNEAFENGYV
ncbi:MAG: hypothetical protein J5965_10595 [Aeriscardovia sp.]|nr:hypothetical protein [Aeriscardovia sp.]